jgi:hypothetical protein
LHGWPQTWYEWRHVIPELIANNYTIIGKEDIYLNWFYDYGSYYQSPITQDDREEYIKQYSKPGALRAGFEYYRAVFEDAKQNKEYGKIKLDIPILTIGEAGIGNFTLPHFKRLQIMLPV